MVKEEKVMKDKNNNTKALFIKTKDKETFEILKQEGFELVDYSNGVWTFVNDLNRPLTFDKNKTVYSNTLCF